MLKKSLIFGIVTLLFAALIALTGCAQATDGESSSSGTFGWNSLYGQMDVLEVQAVINKAAARGEPVYLEDNLIIEPIDYSVLSVVDFKNAAVVINGTVTVEDGIVINGADASVSGAPGAKMTLEEFALSGPSGHIYITRHGLAPVQYIGSEVTLVDLVSRVDDPTATTKVIAVRNYKMGERSEYDYSFEPPIAVWPSVEGLIVLDTLTIPPDASVAASTRIDGDATSKILPLIVGIGTVDLTGTPDEKAIFTEPKTGADFPVVQIGSSATVTTSIGGVELTLPSTAYLPTVKVETGKPFAVKGATNLTINKVEGPGVLNVDVSGLTSIDVIGGDGSITFNRDLGLVETTLTPVTRLTIGSTGKTVFEGLVILPAPAGDVVATIAGDAEFDRGVTLNNKATFNGDVTLHNGVAGVAASTNFLVKIVGGAEVALAKGKTIYVGGQTSPAAVDPIPILSATSAKAVLVATGDVYLAIPNVPNKDTLSEKEADALKKLTLNGGLGVKTGTLQVASGATLALAANVAIPYGARTIAADPSTVASPGFGTIDAKYTDDKTIGYLGIAAGGAISLAAAGNTVTIGDDGVAPSVLPVIETTGTNTSITASGGAVTLGKSTIAGVDDASAVLKLGSNAQSISVPANGILYLDKVALDLTSGAPLTLAAATSTVSLLKSKITLDTKTPVDNPLRFLDGGNVAGKLPIVGIGSIVKGANEKVNAALVELADNTVNPVTVSGGSGGVNIVKNIKLVQQ